MTGGDRIARDFLDAYRARAPYGAPSATQALGLDEAYAVQRAFNDLRATNDRIVGFKAAVNAEAAQRALGLVEPAVGALFASGERSPDDAIRCADFRTLLIETEIGFRASRRIASRLGTPAALRTVIDQCAPVIEFADPGFGRVRIIGTDLIAANAASAGFISGRAQSRTQVDVNDVVVRLERDGTLLHEARSRDLMGDQWQAALWLVNRVIELGYVIEPGHLLMTGALGPAHPAVPGHYRGEFAALGAVTFEVL